MAEKECIYLEWADDKGIHGVRAGELIRCKACKYWGQDGYREGCKYAMVVMTENDYCSNAEREEE